MDDIPVQPLHEKVKQRHPKAQDNPQKFEAEGHAPPDDRRDFLTKAAAVVAGGAVGVCPAIAGMAVLVDPLKRAAPAVKSIRVASLDSIPDDGAPRQFPVIVDYRDDAWTRYRNEPLGAVFLRRDPGSNEVKCWSATCTHAGCFVPYNAEAKQFQCPCHTGTFDIHGAVVGGPPPRPLDTLECEVHGQDVFVKYLDYYAGLTEKKPKI